MTRILTRGVISALGLVAAVTSCERAPQAFRSGDITVSGVVGAAPVVLESLATTTMSVYFTIANSGHAADTLDRVEVTWARTATVHRMSDQGGMSMMMAMEALPVPGLTTVRLAPGGLHLMLEGLSRAPVAGEEVPMVLAFRHAGRVPVRARVLTYDQVAEAFRAGRP